MSTLETRTIDRLRAQIAVLKDELAALKQERVAAMRCAVKLAVPAWLRDAAAGLGSHGFYFQLPQAFQGCIVDEPNIRAAIADLLPPAPK